MNYSKGEWKVGVFPPLDNKVIYTQEGLMLWKREVADCYDNEDDANLIVAAVNSCVKMNPENPTAMAEALPEMYKILKATYNLACGYTEMPKNELAKAIKPILAKAEGK